MIRTVTLTAEQLSNIKDIYLHDAEIKEIACNYIKHKIVISIVLPQSMGSNCFLAFNGVIYSEVSFHEPWGLGYYVLGINVQNVLEDYKTFFDINGVDDFNSVVKDTNCFKITIELNSGDRINIVANEMIYTER